MFYRITSYNVCYTKLLRILKAVLVVGETPLPDFADVIVDPLPDISRDIGEFLDELRRVLLAEAEDVVDDQHLAVAVHASADVV